MEFDNGAADRKSNAHAVLLGRKEGREQLGLIARLNPGSPVGHPHENA